MIIKLVDSHDKLLHVITAKISAVTIIIVYACCSDYDCFQNLIQIKAPMMQSLDFCTLLPCTPLACPPPPPGICLTL